MKRIILIAALAIWSSALSAQVHVMTDRQTYIAGDMVWCSAFSTDSNAVAYLELHSAEGQVLTTKIALDRGRGAGSFRLPASIATGNYRLIAYTDCAHLAAGYDFHDGSVILSVYNTLSGARVDGGVDVGASYSAPRITPVSAGLEIEQTADSLFISNTSGAPVSVAVSVTRADGMPVPAYHSISQFVPRGYDVPAREKTGEIVRGALSGRDAGEYAGDLGLTAFIAVAGDCSCIYSSQVHEGGAVEFHTDNILGDRNLVCQVEGVDPAKDCHFTPDSPFMSPELKEMPRLPLNRDMEQDLLRRTAHMREEFLALGDTVYESLPMHVDHVLMDDECKLYVLDDYTRFPTMQELFVEIIPEMRVRRRGGVNRISVMVYDPDNTRITPVWSNALILVDGVPQFDHDRVMEYDPALIRCVQVFSKSFCFGERVYDGVANLVTFQGTMPSVTFDDNVRIYDFKGVSAPMSYKGSETLWWHPLLRLAPGGRVAIERRDRDCKAGISVMAEGLTESGRAVYARKYLR